MCIIIYSTTGRIHRAELKRALAANRDGWGILSVADRWVERGMDIKEFWRAWEARPAGPVVIHARIGTSGQLGIANCHPFPLLNSSWVFHNGVLPLYANPQSPYCDTYHFTQRILSNLPLGWEGNPAIRYLVSAHIGGSKLVVVSSSQVTIINEHLGYWRNGTWYSNSCCHQPRRRPQPQVIGLSLIDHWEGLSEKKKKSLAAAIKKKR